jgi:hypothetical protein
MKKFSQSTVEYNPFSENTLEGKLYKLIESKLSSKTGKVVGIKELVLSLTKMTKDEILERYVNLLEKTKQGIEDEDIEKEEVDDFSAKINSMTQNDEDIADEKEDDFSQQHNTQSDQISE